MPSYQDQQGPLAPPDAPSRLGRYELLGKLATGGMSEIHLARLAGEAGFEKLVVVKRLLPELVASPTYVAMFLDEGKLVARLDHPNICEVHELGREGADYYLAMPYLDGVAVTELIARPRDPDRTAQLRVAAGVIVQACAGLHHAHELRDADGAPAHLVHRDVSPSNLFATVAGVIKVLDFGIAKVRGAAATEVGMIKGKQQYMAPEQLLGDPVDRRCDVFALGIVLYELATHQRLFKRPSDYLAARAILEEPIPRADAVDPAVPPALADVIAKALQRKPSDRYATARALADVITAALTPATADQIAAMVTSSDELSAQRTRQSRVLGEARSRSSAPAPSSELATAPRLAPRIASSPGAEVAPLSNVAPPADSDVATKVRLADPTDPTVITPHRRPRAPLLLALAAIAVLAIVIGFLVGRGDDGPDHARTPIAHGTRDQSPPAPGPLPPAGTAALTHPTTPAPTSSAQEPVTPPPTRTPTAPTPTAAPAKPAKPAGLFSIDSTPYATIFVDGNRLGITPIVKHVLPAGRHTLRAVLRDGRSREQTLDVPAGKLAPPIQLTW